MEPKHTMNDESRPAGRTAPVAPFWFWNGELETERLEEQIEAMAGQGLRAFIICPRQGLTTPYLSARWFERVRQAVAAAKRYGMEVWLYDEQPYPSLAGGGRVVLDRPEFEAKELRVHTAAVTPGEPLRLELGWGEVLSAGAYPVRRERNRERLDLSARIELGPCIGQLFGEEVFHETGLTAYNRKRFLACSPFLRLDWTPGPRDTRRTGDTERFAVYVFCQVPVRGHKYFDRFPDPLNPEAVEYFLHLVHRRYAEELGGEFGSTIRGFFTDEVHPIGFEGGGIPWSPRLPGLYTDRYGQELPPLLPALVDDRFPDCAQVRYRFMHTVTEGFIESYDRTVAAWCLRHRILYIGEKPILRSAQLAAFDIPGIDAGHEKAGGAFETHPARYRANPRILASAAHFYGKSRCLCECFHSIGWGMELQDMKLTFDRLALEGINLFVPHAYYYTAAGLTKHDAPPSGFIQMPWWPLQHRLSAYTDELLTWTDPRDRRPKILVLDPAGSNWSISFAAPEARTRAAERFAELQRILFSRHFDFWIVEGALVSGVPAPDRNRSGGIRIGRERFECLIVPPVERLEPDAAEAIRSVLASGGRVIFCGPQPEEPEPDSGTEELERLRTEALTVSEAAELPRLLEALGLRDFSLTDGMTGKERTDLHAMLYERGGVFRAFALNPGPEPAGTLVFTAYGEDGPRTAGFELGPFESRFLELPGSGTGKARYSGRPLPAVELVLDREHEVRPVDVNVLLLDRWELGTGLEEKRTVVHAKPIIDQLAEGGFSLPVVRSDRFGTPKTLLFTPFTAVYRTRFEAASFDGPLELRIEPGAVTGLRTVRFNGAQIPPGRVGQRYGLELETMRLGRAVRGMNELEITVAVERPGDGLRAPVHVAGAFAVLLPGTVPVLDAPRSYGNPLDRRSSGLPFYAGQIRYAGAFTAKSSPDGIRLRISDSRWRSAVRLTVNGRKLGGQAWHPFEWTVPAELLRQDGNRYELEVLTERQGYFEGQRYDPVLDRYIDLGT